MSKLTKYAKTSKIMEVSLSYKGEKYSFNLYEELRISEQKITQQLKTHVNNYAFIAMLHRKLVIQHKELKLKLERKMERLRPMYKKKYKLSSLKAAEAKLVKKDKSIREMEGELLKLEEIRDILGIAVTSFEYRKDLLQTISANIRKER